MKKFVPTPLHIHCDGLSKKAIAELADQLSLYFFDVDFCCDSIFAAQPVSHHHYDKAWILFDKLNLQVS